MNREFGGFLCLENIYKSEYYTNLLDFNCSRNSLRYIIRKRNIKKIFLPKLNCYVVDDSCKKENVEICYYNIDKKFLPILDSTESYVYIVNYCGLITTKVLKNLTKKYKNIIFDNTHNFFQKYLANVDTIYNCRKFFGVADGSYLYSKIRYDNSDLSYQSSKNLYSHLLGRFEDNSASKYYEEFKKNDLFFESSDINKMSKISKNIMGAIDYNKVMKIRKKNFKILNKKLQRYNQIKLNNEMLFMYPLLVKDGVNIKKKLIEKKVFVPTLWPNVLENADKNSFEYYVVNNIILLPIDQRYDENDMIYISDLLISILNG